VKNELYAQAIATYEPMLVTQPASVLHVTLGDLYREIDLQRYAFAAYQAALVLLNAGEDDLAVRAAAEFGMGQVEYSRGNFKEAEQHYEKAIALYLNIDAPTELQAVQQALVETKERLPEDSDN